VFATQPRGATAASTVKKPARRRDTAFQGSGWEGPAVVQTFAAPGPPAGVYRFYAKAARGAGWRATASGALGLTDRWAKTYPDGAAATLVLSRLGAGTYRLSGGIAPVPG
jgi:hypothetical protein